MSRSRKGSNDKLENLLSGLERSFLSAPDSEFRGARSAAGVRSLIAQIASTDTKSRATAEGRRSARRAVLPAERSRRLSFLKQLLSSRPELSPRMAAVFGSGRRPSDKEMDVLTNELVRLGVLKRE